MYRAPHSTGIANQGVNIVDENLEDVELDPQSDPGPQTDYPISLIITTMYSKSITIFTPWVVNIVAGQYIVITLNTTITGIDPNDILGERKVLIVSGVDNNSLTFDADAEATASGWNASLGSVAETPMFRISPILSTMPNKTIRFYVNTDDNGMKNLNVRYQEDGVDYHTDICEFNV
jgi:hypothetical protein